MTEQIRLTLKGMTNRPDALFSEDGECSTLVNLRCREGAWAPIGEPTPLFTPSADNRKLVFVHKNESYTHYLTYDGTSLFYEEPGGKNLLIAAVSGLINIESIGNTLVVFSKERMEYALYLNGAYQWLGAKPAFPPATFTLIDSSEKTATNTYDEYRLETAAVSGDNYRLSETDIRKYSDFILGAYNKGIAELEEKGLVSQAVLIKYALRTYDGNYLLQSAPILLVPLGGANPIKTISAVCTMDSNKITRLSGGEVVCKGYSVQFNRDAIALEAWSDIVVAIDVFISQPISMLLQEKYFNVYNYINTDGQKRLTFSLPRLSETDLETRIGDETLFYKMGSFDNFKEGSSYLSLDGVFSALNTRPRLPLDDRMHHHLSAATSHVYNGKLHIANLSTRLYSGFSPKLFMTGSDFYNGEKMPFNKELKRMYIEVYLKAATGTARLVADSGTQVNNFKGFTSLVSYPDSRAYRMVITLCFSDATLYRRDIPLKRSNTQDIAYYLQPECKPLLFVHIEGSTYIPQPEVNITEMVTNKMKVSEVNNPFLFPVSRTYTISNGRIEGVAAAAASLSQGQYGEFPLYVFTDEGIWALQTGTGEVAYTNQVVVNREVCNNPASITSLDNSVAYTTSRGLMLLEGNDSRLLSMPIGGEFDSSLLRDKEALPSLLREAATDTTPFLDYLDEASIGFHYPENELIVMNHASNYYYVFSQTQSLWSKRTGNYRALYAAWPGLLVTDSAGTICDLSVEKPVTTDILIVTRAIKGNHPDMYKHLRRVIWRMHATEAALKMMVYGSHIPQSAYSSLLKATIKGEVQGKISLPLVGGSYSYHRLLLSGRLSADAHIEAIDVAYQPIFENKMR